MEAPVPPPPPPGPGVFKTQTLDTSIPMAPSHPPPPPALGSSPPKTWKSKTQKPAEAQPEFTYTRGDPHKADWSQIEDVHFSDTGAEGVIFVNTVGNGTVVLKGSATLAQDYFATLLAEELSIPVAHMRIIDYSDGTREWSDLLMHMRAWAAKNSDSNGRSKSRKGVGKRCFIECMEMIVGQQLNTISEADATRYFSGETTDSISFLTLMGRIIALDVLLNNWDRIPVIWDNEGNWGNLIVSHDSGRLALVGIDNGFSFISSEHEKKLDAYLSRVHKLIQDAKKGMERGKECPQMASIRSSYMLHTGFQIPDNVFIHTQKALIEELERIPTILTTEKIDTLVAKVRSAIVRDWGGMWELGMRAVGSDFLPKMVEALARMK
eukprot:TRINITY_DN6600_c0_g1_i1.p1 TRINITY_DN6600_c0_g1~~TRINITY_DN6600_c0_g1_i1.p1  ORF type:complete len:380 (-),score=60.38 TRINITY_DN6600_c0_g1_i1:757-1896(-)